MLMRLCCRTLSLSRQLFPHEHRLPLLLSIGRFHISSFFHYFFSFFFVSMHETRLASSQVLSARKYNLYPMSYRIVLYTA